MLITIEGTEGSGKSTLSQALFEECQRRRIAVIRTREPGGVFVAEEIRKVILNHTMSPMTELFLYEAARFEHWKRIIQPALAKKKWVICDRFTDSTLAYQGYARGLDLKTIRKLNQWATESRAPDLTLFLDLPISEGLKRASDPNRFEREAKSFHEKVRKGFLEIAKKERRRFKRIDVRKKSPEEVFQEAWDLIQKNPAYRKSK